MRSVGVELSTGDFGVQGCGLGWGDVDEGCTRVDDGDETLGDYSVVVGKTIADDIPDALTSIARNKREVFRLTGELGRVDAPNAQLGTFSSLPAQVKRKQVRRQLSAIRQVEEPRGSFRLSDRLESETHQAGIRSVKVAGGTGDDGEWLARDGQGAHSDGFCCEDARGC